MVRTSKSTKALNEAAKALAKAVEALNEAISSYGESGDSTNDEALSKATARVEANMSEYLADIENFKKISHDDAYVAAAILSGITMSEMDHQCPSEWDWLEGESLDSDEITNDVLRNCAIETVYNIIRGDVADDEDTDVFESTFRSSKKKLNEAKASTAATKLVDALPRDLSVSADVDDFVIKCAKFLGDSTAVGEQGWIDDLPDFYKKISGTIPNKILAYVVIHSPNPEATKRALLARKKKLNMEIQTDVIDKAIALAKSSKTLSLSNAQKIARRA